MVFLRFVNSGPRRHRPASPAGLVWSWLGRGRGGGKGIVGFAIVAGEHRDRGNDARVSFPDKFPRPRDPDEQQCDQQIADEPGRVIAVRIQDERDAAGELEGERRQQQGDQRDLPRHVAPRKMTGAGPGRCRSAQHRHHLRKLRWPDRGHVWVLHFSGLNDYRWAVTIVSTPPRRGAGGRSTIAIQTLARGRRRADGRSPRSALWHAGAVTHRNRSPSRSSGTPGEVSGDSCRPDSPGSDPTGARPA